MDKVLLVGDALAQDGDLRRTIEREGFSVTGTNGRESALCTVAAAAPAVVIVDLAPEDGLALLRDIRAGFPACEVVFVATNGGDMDLAIDVLRAGALDYLHHPLDFEQLRRALGRSKQRPPQLATSRPPALLLLEDHEPTRRRLSHVLEKEGYRVQSAADGAEGLERFHAQRFDLILADLRMPRVDGLEVLRETKGKGVDVEVIIFSGHGSEEVVIEALRAGAADFLRKPIDVDQTLRAIEKALETQKLRRSLACGNRDVANAQDVVLRLTGKLELVVETPSAVSAPTREFLTRVGHALPLGLIMVAADGRVVFANRHITEKLDAPPTRLSPDWLARLGLGDTTQEALDEALQRVLRSEMGTFETLILSPWAFLMLAPLKLVQADGTPQLMALAVRGERGTGRPGGGHAAVAV